MPLSRVLCLGELKEIHTQSYFTIVLYHVPDSPQPLYTSCRKNEGNPQQTQDAKTMLKVPLLHNSDIKPDKSQPSSPTGLTLASTGS